MQLEFPKAESHHVQALADMHMASLPTSVLSALGATFLKAFYRFALSSPQEEVVVCVKDGTPIAGALISDSPETLNRRLLFTSPLAWAVLANFHKPIVREAVFGKTEVEIDADQMAATDTPTPELLTLFTDERARGQGIGAALIDEVDRRMSKRGLRRYFVRTTEDRDNPALRFYSRCGFTSAGRIRAHGVAFALLVKQLGTTRT